MLSFAHLAENTGHRAHADHGQIADGPAVENGTVAQGDPLANGLGVTGWGMNDDALFNSRSLADHDAAVIAADNSAMADITLVANNDIPNDVGQFADVGAGFNLWLLSVESV
jgi:hypothetical protein